jgi:CHAD domain-containing protein
MRLKYQSTSKILEHIAMAHQKTTYNYPADISFRRAAAQTLLPAFVQMQASIPGTWEGCQTKVATAESVKALHDMRVATRRIRAALAVFVKVFNKNDWRFLETEIKGLTEALGLVRDYDVQIEIFSDLKETLPPNEAYGIERAITRLISNRQKARKGLKKVLKRWKKNNIEGHIEQVLQKNLKENKENKESKESKEGKG